MQRDEVLETRVQGKKFLVVWCLAPGGLGQVGNGPERESTEKR